MSRDLRIDELDPLALTAADDAAWRALAADAIEPNPFADPDVVVPAVRHLAAGADVRLAVARDGDRWLAALPVTAERAWHRLPVPGLVGWRHPYTFLGTPLLAAEAPERAAGGLVALCDARPSRGLLAMDQVGADGPVAELLRGLPRPGRAHELEPEDRAALRRRPQDDYVDSHRSGKRRREAARLRRRLASDLGEEPVLRRRGVEPEAVERFLALEAEGWKGREGTALASDPEHAAFLRAIAVEGTPSLRAEILELGLPDRPAAMLFNLVAGDTAFSLKLAHDEELQPGAPGVQLMTDAVGWWHDGTAAERYDSCAVPGNPMINGLWPDRRATASFVVTGGGPSGWAARTAVSTFDDVRRRRDAARVRAERQAAGSQA